MTAFAAQTPFRPLVLQVLSGTLQGQQIVVDRPILLGRDPRSRVPFDDDLISRHHALIDLSPSGTVIIRDLGSKNGTFINSHEIQNETELKPGDRLRLGRTFFLVQSIEETHLSELEKGDRLFVSESTHSDSLAKTSAEKTEEERMQLDRRALRRVVEIASHVSALCRVRNGLKSVTTAVRKEFGAAACAIIAPRAPFHRVAEDGDLHLDDGVLRRIDAVVSSEKSSSGFVTADGSAPMLLIPLFDGDHRRGFFLLSREKSNPFEPERSVIGDALSECLRSTVLGRILGESFGDVLPGNLGLVGGSEVMNRVREQLRTYAATNATVLIRGESGTGKEVAAKAIALLSSRRTLPYVELNCACMRPDLIEAELFGHEKGAFTGAVASRIGKLELANMGTLFLDEIGEIPLDLQAKLLRVLEGQSFYPLGSNREVRVDVRFVCATNRDLEQMVKQGKFRRDLYHRINILGLEMPPLRTHLEDLPELVNHFMEQVQEEFPDKQEFTIMPKALRRLLAHHWPGNARELRNVVQRMLLLSNSNQIDEKMVPPGIGDQQETTTSKFPRLQLLTEMMEREEITRALLEANGQKSAAARLLGISRPTLDKKIRQYGLSGIASSRQKDNSADGSQND